MSLHLFENCDCYYFAPSCLLAVFIRSENVIDKNVKSGATT